MHIIVNRLFAEGHSFFSERNGSWIKVIFQKKTYTKMSHCWCQSSCLYQSVCRNNLNMELKSKLWNGKTRHILKVSAHDSYNLFIYFIYLHGEFKASAWLLRLLLGWKKHKNVWHIHTQQYLQNLYRNKLPVCDYYGKLFASL